MDKYEARYIAKGKPDLTLTMPAQSQADAARIADAWRDKASGYSVFTIIKKDENNGQ